jgi:hypothetical protein
LYIKHTKDADGVEKIKIDQTLTGGIPGSSEERILAWEEREVNDPTYGAILTKARRVKPSELDVEWLKMNWTADTAENGVVQIISKSDTPKSGYTWSADQVRLIWNLPGGMLTISLCRHGASRKSTVRDATFVTSSSPVRGRRTSSLVLSTTIVSRYHVPI